MKSAVYIHKEISETAYHIRVLEDRLEKSYKLENNSVPPFGSAQFLEFSKVFCVDPPMFPPQEFQAIYRSLVPEISGIQIPWKNCIPETVWKTSLKNVVEKLRAEFLPLDTEYWFNFYIPSNEVFSYLQPAKINQAYFEKIPDKRQVEFSFSPNKTGFTTVPVYSRCDTITGREVILQGPQIGLLKKEYRHSMFESTFGAEGILLYLDFSALEPTTFCHIGSILNNKEPIQFSDDLYLSIKKENGFVDLSRDIVKDLVLSELYGIGYDKVSDKISFQEFYRLSQKLRDSFGIQAIEQWTDNKSDSRFIYNWYGRRLPSKEFPTHKRTNHLIQSTAADIAHLGFSILVGWLKQEILAENVRPLYTIHDALILDVKKKLVDDIKERCEKLQTQIPGFEGKRFLLKTDVIQGLK